MKFFIATLIFFTLATTGKTAEDVFDTERLPIGDSIRKYDFSAVKLDKILNTQTNQAISVDQLITSLQSYRIVMVGESHTNHLHHDMQLAIIKGLAEAGTPVCIALEYFTPAQNEALKRWSDGKTDEETFIRDVNYFETWGHNYRYYQPIFSYAREKHIPMYGVNTDRKYASKIGMSGLAGLSNEDRAAIPTIDTSNVEHRYYVKVAMEGMDATAPAQFRNIYAAQSLWDTVMGEGAIDVAHKHPEAIVIVLAGSGHVAYNLGIGRIINDRSDLPFASVLAVDVPDSMTESVMMKVKKSIKKEEQPEKSDTLKGMTNAMAAKKMPSMQDTPQMSKQGQKGDAPNKMPSMGMMHGMGQADDTPYRIVSRSLADFLWGKKELEKPKYPSFGFSTDDKTDQGFPIKRVIPETIAQKQGLQRGDVIVSIDGISFDTSLDFKRYLHMKNWGDEIVFSVLRDSEQVDIGFVIENDEE